jgi:hypothetical protein
MCLEREEAKEMVGKQLSCLAFPRDFVGRTAGVLITCHFSAMPVMMENRFSIIKRTTKMRNLLKGSCPK